MDIKLYEVGGCVRDEILGHPTKDVDFAVEASSFDAMVQFIESEGHKIVDSRPEFLTVRAVVHKDHPLRSRTNAADFVMCREDGSYTDGRRPDSVRPGTIMDDLARRDFTMNAMAREVQTDGTLGPIMDPYGGMLDLERGTINFVGNPSTRIAEDGLRVIRAVRFAVTKDMVLAAETTRAIRTIRARRMLSGVAIERVRDEVDKMFRHDTVRSMQMILDTRLSSAVFRDGLHLEASLRKR